MSIRDDTRSTYSEGITIHVQPPSALSPTADSEHRTPLSPFSPQEYNEEIRRHSMPQASSSRHTGATQDQFNAGPILENGEPSSASTTRQFPNDELGASAMPNDHWATQTMHSIYSPAPRFTAIDPFAHRKHRLSWSSILSVKDGGRKRQDNNAPDAWTLPLPHNDSDDLPPELYEEDRPSREALPYGPYPEQAPAHRRHSTQTPLPTSFPISESQINSPYDSDHSSTSSRRTYYSFEDGRGRKSPRQATQPNTIPTLRFGTQPTNTTIGSVAPSERPPQNTSILDLFAKVFPAQAYLYVLLGLPGLYFSRVATIFEDANLSSEKMKLMILNSEGAKLHPDLFMVRERDPAYRRLTKSWKHFIDTVIREWKTLNLISVLLLSAIVAILQIDSAFQDPVVHYSALYSLICALLSLLFGCMYILRFNTMRLPHKAIPWAHETQKENANRFWNVWILLAIPAVWLVWSLVFYIVCIMAFVWRVETQNPPLQLPRGLILAVRIGISVALGVGFIYGVVVMRTFINFGSPMDVRFRAHVDRWVEQKANKSQKRPPSMYNVPIDRIQTPRPNEAPAPPPPDHVADRNGVLPGRPNVTFQTPWSQAHPNAQFYTYFQPPSLYPHSTRSSVTSLNGNVVRPAGVISPYPLPPLPPTYPPPAQIQPENEPEGQSHHVRFRSVTESDMMPPPAPPTGPLPPEVKPSGRSQRQKTPEPSPRTPVSRPSRRQLIPSTASGGRRRPPELLLSGPQDGLPPPLPPPAGAGAGPASGNGTGVGEPVTPLSSASSSRPVSGRLRVPVTITEDSESAERASGGESPVPLIQLSSSSPSPLSSPASPSESVISFNLGTGDPSNCLLNQSPFAVVYEGREYPTAEHLFQAMRFIDQYPHVADQIRTKSDFRELKPFVDAYAEQFGRTDWEGVVLDKLEEVMMLKFHQHPELKHFLLGTGTRLLVYSDDEDGILGSGGDRRGRNEIGKALMRVRERFRQEPLLDEQGFGSRPTQQVPNS